MKRVIPILGIFLVTTITTILWFNAKEDKDWKSELEERCADSKPIDEIVGIPGRNPFSVMISGPPAVDEKIDEFDNTTTWKYDTYSSNALPYRYKSRFCGDKFFISKSSARLDITCTKYGDTSGKYELRFKPPSNLETSFGDYMVDIKWDDMPPKRITVDRYGNFSNAEDLIKKLEKHSKLQIRYKDWQGAPVAEFVPDEDKLVSEIVKKCSWQKTKLNTSIINPF